MTVILVLYVLIGIRLYRSNMLGTQGGYGEHSFSITSKNSGSCKFKTLKQPQIQQQQQVTQQQQQQRNLMEGVMYRYSGGGAQLSAVRGRMSQYGTRRVLRMLGKWQISKLSIIV